jgi:hypothetical protein
METRINARMSRIESNVLLLGQQRQDLLVPLLPNAQGAYPPNAESLTVRQFQSLNSAQVNQLATFYGIQVSGNLTARRSALANHLGLSLNPV